MPSAAQVRPENWSDITVLFDNGRYSVISGVYENGYHTLGERWNGQGDDLGFPSVAGYAVWHVVPEFLHRPILHGLLGELARHPDTQRPENVAAILREIAMTHRGSRQATGT